jgi:hypothetical protein
MIKLIQKLRKKYKEIAKQSEYVSTNQIENDLYQLEQQIRINRLPKNER